MEGRRIPHTVFMVRVRDDRIKGDNPYKWKKVTSKELFKGKSALLFSLPGAFTPTCDTFQLPTFEKMYSKFKKKGVDEIFCLSVNDSFVMNAWGKSQKLKNVQLIPDGSGEFTRKMGMLVQKTNLGFGLRSWRYAALITNEKIVKWFEEPGFKDNASNDPYKVTMPEYILSNI